MDVPESEVTLTDEEVVQVLPTQTVAVPLTAPVEDVSVTVMVTDEAAVIDRALINPVLLTLTAEGWELSHAVPLLPVTFCVVPSLKVPVAVNWVVWLRAVNEGLVGVIVMLLRVGSTKKPLQPTANAANIRAAIAPTILIFCFVFSILIIHS